MVQNGITSINLTFVAYSFVANLLSYIPTKYYWVIIGLYY